MPKFGKEDDLVKKLQLVDEECQSQTEKLQRRAKENLELLRGPGQWKMSRNPYFLFNLIEKCVENKVAKTAEVKPTIRIFPDRDGVEESCEAIKKCVDSYWDERHVSSKLERLGLFGGVMGAGFAGTPFNRELNHGDGDIDFIARDPRTVGFDSAVIDPSDLDQAEFVRIQEIMPLDVIRNAFQGRGALVTRDDRVSAFEEAGKSPIGAFRSAIQRWTGKSGGKLKDSAISRCMVKEFYIKDRRSSVEETGEFPIVEGLTQYAEKGKPFPGGRRILASTGEKDDLIILKDEFNPYWDGNPPIDMLSWRMDLESAWGPDEIQRLKRIQEALNRIGDAYVKNMILNSVVRLIVDKGAMDPDELKKLSNNAAEIIYKNPGREVNHNVPPPLPTETLAFMNRLIELGEILSGTAESGLQKRVPSIVTGPAVEGLQLALETSQRAVARRLEDFLQRVGQKVISRVFQYYNNDRLLHYLGPTEEWVAFSFERSKLIMSKGKPRTQEDIRKAYRDFKYKVEPGSSLAIARMQRAMMMAKFSEQGWLPPWKVMEEMGIGDAESQYKKAQAEIQAGRMMPPVQQGKGGGVSNIGKAVGM